MFHGTCHFFRASLFKSESEHLKKYILNVFELRGDRNQTLHLADIRHRQESNITYNVCIGNERQKAYSYTREQYLRRGSRVCVNHRFSKKKAA